MKKDRLQSASLTGYTAKNSSMRVFQIMSLDRKLTIYITMGQIYTQRWSES